MSEAVDARVIASTHTRHRRFFSRWLCFFFSFHRESTSPRVVARSPEESAILAAAANLSRAKQQSALRQHPTGRTVFSAAPERFTGPVATYESTPSPNTYEEATISEFDKLAKEKKGKHSSVFKSCTPRLLTPRVVTTSFVKPFFLHFSALLSICVLTMSKQALRRH